MEYNRQLGEVNQVFLSNMVYKADCKVPNTPKYYKISSSLSNYFIWVYAPDYLDNGENGVAGGGAGRYCAFRVWGSKGFKGKDRNHDEHNDERHDVGANGWNDDAGDERHDGNAYGGQHDAWNGQRDDAGHDDGAPVHHEDGKVSRRDEDHVHV